MSAKVQSYDVVVATGTTSTNLMYVDKYDQCMLAIPKVVGFCGSSPVAITLRGTTNGSSAQNMSYFDYVNKTPATCVITVSTGGIYEFPYPGAQQSLSIQFDTAVTNVTTVQLVCPKTTY